MLQRCGVCRSMLDEEDMFCSNCGTEGPSASNPEVATEQQASLHSYRCESCGASMSYDASSQSLRCPFCGSESLTAQKDARTLKPNWVVPFQVDRNQVQAILQKFLSTGFWRPGDAAQNSMVHDIVQVYVPFWVFSAKTQTFWTADSSRTPAGASGDWYPMSGEHQGEYSGILVVASSTLTPSEVQAVSPFHFERVVKPETVDLLNVIVEEFRLPRKYARPLAQSTIESLEASQCTQYVPGRCRKMQVNVKMGEMRSEPVLLPIWILVYRYKNQPYRVLINGQTGSITGAAPFSYSKLGIVLVIAAIIIGMLILIAMVASSR